MIFKSKKKLISYIKSARVSHAGTLPGKTTGGKSHVLNITYDVDQTALPSIPISDIILTLSDTKISVMSPKISLSSNSQIARNILALNANIRAANSNTKTSAYGKKESGVSFAGNKNLNISYNLLDPFYSRSEKLKNIQKFLDRKIDENVNAADYSGINTAKVSYGTRQTIKMVRMGNQSAQKKSIKTPQVSIRSEGVSAKVLVVNNSRNTNPDLDMESLTNSAGYPYSSGGDFNRSALGDQGKNIFLDLGYYNSFPDHVDPMSDLVNQGISTLTLDKFSGRNVNKGDSAGEILYEDACYYSATIDKIDPAKSALVAPIVDTGINSTIGVKSSSRFEENIKSASKKQMKVSNRQITIKNSCNLITRPTVLDYNDIPNGESFPISSLEAATYATVSQMIPINSAYASSYNVIYANISVYTTDGKVVQDYDFEIPMGTILNESDIPIEPPSIGSAVSKNGIVTLEIKQIDKKATGIEVYARHITRRFQNSLENPWQKITDVNISSEDGSFFVDHAAETSATLIYRAIAKTGSRKSSNFGSTISQPIDGFGKSLSEKVASASIYATIDTNGNVEVVATNITGGSQSINLVRRNLSLFENNFTPIPNVDQSQFVNTGGTATFIDSQAQDGYLYEYTISSISFDGVESINPTSTILEYTIPSKEVSLSVGSHTALQGISTMYSNVAIPVETKFQSDQDAIISKIINASGVSKESIEIIPDIMSRASQITGTLITRLNETTGDSAYLGFFPSGDIENQKNPVFIDAGDEAANISPPQIGKKYRYIFEAVLGDISSIVEDSKFREQRSTGSGKSSLRSSVAEINLQKERNKNDLTFTNDASSGLTPDPKNPNRPDKFFNSRTLGRGRDAGTLVIPKSSTSQEIESGRTGVYSTVFVDLSDNSVPTVTKASCRTRSDGNVIIEWSVKDNKNIDHFLVQETRYGNSSVSLSAHNNPSKGKYVIIDPFSRSRPGSVSYSIIPVDINYKKGEPFPAGSVVIYPESLHAITVSKDMPDQLATSNKGTDQYPEI
jgi:hypothetical protein